MLRLISGKNTADIALALDAMETMFDQRADTFCLVTSDSDFAYLCRKLRERGATVCIVGESKTPEALRNASDQFLNGRLLKQDMKRALKQLKNSCTRSPSVSRPVHQSKIP